jgi:hypothetical protein
MVHYYQTRDGIYIYVCGILPGGKGWNIFLQLTYFCHLTQVDSSSVEILISNILYGAVSKASAGIIENMGMVQ